MKYNYLMLHILLTSIFILYPKKSNSQNFSEISKAVASDRDSPDLFGYSIAIEGNYAVIGAYQQKLDASGLNSLTNSGAAYIFQKDGSGNWSQVQKIVASDRGTSDRFGRSVSISNDFLIVGAYQEDEDASGNNPLNGAGSAYVFKRDVAGTWNEVQKIVASDRGAGDRFGQAVSIDGDYLIVGANLEDEDATASNTLSSSGSAYIFEKDGSDNWSEVQKITASDRQANDQFGWSLSISGSYAVVGAYFEDDDVNGANTLNNSGSAYIFERDGSGNWIQVDKVVASARADNDQFGYSVSILGNFIAIGSIGDDEDENETNTFNDAGSVYVYIRDGSGNWNHEAKVVTTDRAEFDAFGRSVSLSGNYLAVGADEEDEDTNGSNTLSNAGSAYLFSRNSSGNWSQNQKLSASDRAVDDVFGWSVALDNENLVVGAYLEDEDVSGSSTLASAGSVYFFENPTLSIEDELSLKNEFRIFPNPTRDILNIKHSGIDGINNAVVYDLTGRFIKKISIDKDSQIQPFDFSNLPSGNYFIEIKTDAGKITKRFFKY